VTPASKLGERVTVEPLANLPVLTDLVVDLGEFHARFPDPHPTLRASTLVQAAGAPAGFVQFEDCLECALCLSACPVASTSRHYVGPAALSAAQRLLEEPRGTDTRSVLDWADGPEGAWRCHAAYECTEACPVNARPAERIMALRGELLHGRDRGERC
jgi:succinate dehydrogenase/fumarate reductase iron-sulfur protein